MPELELTPEMIAPNRTRLTLSYIEGIMLWPNAPNQRALAESAAAAVFMEEGIHSDDRPVSLTGHDLRWLISEIRNAPPLPEIQEAAKLPFTRGVVAGQIFLETLHATATGRNRNLQQIKEDVGKRLSGKQYFKKLSMGTIENQIWAVLRPVSHLWAAYLVQESGDKGAHPFPCRLAELPEFLGLSETLRVTGEACAIGAGRTLLDPAKMWRTPPRVAIPSVLLTWNKNWTLQSSKAA